MVLYRQRKDADKLEFEQWPNVTRFRNWKTAFRRGVITGSTDRYQDFGNVGTVFGTCHVSFETLADCEKPRANHEHRVQETNSVDDDKPSLADVPRAVCVTHKSLNHKEQTAAAKPCLK